MKVSPRRRWKQRFRRGCHPDSLANLGSTPMYDERKVYFSVGMTPSSKEKLADIAEKNNLSFSEVLERIARGLTVADIQRLVHPRA